MSHATQVELRKIVVCVESITHDFGPPLARPLLKGWVACVIRNPFAGRHEPHLTEFMDSLKPVAIDLSNQLLAALAVAPKAIEVFGKGSMVGTAGEIEHAAMWHAPGGAGIKQVLGARGFVSAGKIMGALGARLQIPLVYINSPWVRSHYNTIELSVYDAPKPDELVFALAVGTGGRIHARLGGVSAADAEAGKAPKF